ncbi:MAG: DUF1232 domain-containing protein [Peptostreptococcaceae bacterium]|nr:DUF1232 domain-containing protein [Peptostreptococcaceae bacterium]
MKLRLLEKEKAMAFFAGLKEGAEETLKDKEKTKKIVADALDKARETKGPFAELLDDIMLMFSMAADYVKGNYRNVPIGTIVVIIAGAIYLLTPIDVIPDFIPVVGYLDDAFVLGIVIKQARSDLEKYRIWKAEQKKIQL